MATGMGETLIQKLTIHMQEQLIINGITDFIIDNGNFLFKNADDKSRASIIIQDYLTHLLNNDTENLM
ncbi:MAG: hypothetical protein H6Q72_4367 [Firmicutes bacterium]|nr:hypothetical protein [Bacillota bacterium]